MDELETLIDQLAREDRDQTMSMTPAQRLRAGGDLFDDACRWTLAGIRRDHPGISESEALEELRRRIACAEERENRA